MRQKRSGLSRLKERVAPGEKTCDYCDKRFRTEDALYEHLRECPTRREMLDKALEKDR